MKTNTLHLLAAVALAAAPCFAIGPDAFGYTATNQVPYSYQNIAQSGATVLAGNDEGTATLQIGFPFKFYGSTYSSLCVSANGLIAFGGCWADFANIDLTQQAPAQGGDLPLIAPFWDDLNFSFPGSGGIVYQTLGSAPSRRFVIQWNRAFGLNTPSPLNFEVILFEGTNKILFQYQDAQPGLKAVDKGAGATVGIRANGGHSNGKRLQWSYNVPVIASASAVEFTPPVTAGATDVSAKITATLGALVFNRLNNTYVQTVTIKNTSNAAISRPITIVFTALPAGITVSNATGVGLQGPFITLSGSTPLAAGGSLSQSVTFSGGTATTIRYTLKTYSGAY